MRVVFCGFMGAGKSYLLQRMSSDSSDLCRFADLDQLIFQQERSNESSLAELINSKGWSWFRSLESILLTDFLSKNEKCMLALGGGALSHQDNLSKIKSFENCHLVWLNTSFETCYRRISEDRIERPLLKDGRDMLVEIFNRRQADYAQADLVLDEDQQQLINCLDDLTIRLSVSN